MKLNYENPSIPSDLERPSNVFVLYAHYIEDNLLYLGSGSIKRAFSTDQRNADWHKAMKEAEAADVYFLDVGDNEAAIRCHEHRLINRLRPPCNKYHNPDYRMSPELREAKRLASIESWRDRTAHPHSVISCIQNCAIARKERSKPILRSDGQRFPSLAEAARAVPCSPATITKRISDGTSWKGFKFQYA